MSIQELQRKLRFPPMMGGNRESITLPCSFVSRLLYIAEAAKVYLPRDLYNELHDAELQAGEVIKSGTKIIHGDTK